MTVTSPRSWRALEANPEVITKYAEALGGPQNLSFCDVMSLEDWALELVPQPVHALLLVYPIKKNFEERSKELQTANKLECDASEAKKSIVDQLWFTKQVREPFC